MSAALESLAENSHATCVKCHVVSIVTGDRDKALRRSGWNGNDPRNPVCGMCTYHAENENVFVQGRVDELRANREQMSRAVDAIRKARNLASSRHTRVREREYMAAIRILGYFDEYDRHMYERTWTDRPVSWHRLNDLIRLVRIAANRLSGSDSTGGGYLFTAGYLLSAAMQADLDHYDSVTTSRGNEKGL